MTKTEISKLIAVAASNFPNLQDKDLTPTAYLWYNLLKDMPYEVGEKALLKVLSTAKFFPPIAVILEAAHEITAPKELLAIEAWGEVKRAIGHYGMTRKKEAFASMSEKTAKVMEAFGWEGLCMSDINEEPVMRAQFMKAYDAYAEREKQDNLLPAGLKKQIAQIGHLRLAAGDK